MIKKENLFKLLILAALIISGIAPDIFNFTFNWKLWCDYDFLWCYDFNYVSTKGNSRLFLFLYQFGFSIRLLLVLVYLRIEGPLYKFREFHLEYYIRTVAIIFAAKDCIDEVLWHNVTQSIEYELVALIIIIVTPLIFTKHAK